MKKISFDFLKDMPLKEIDKSPVNVNGGKSPAAGADFRLFADGSIYPSLERIKQDQLEFQNKDSEATEFGYDVFLSTDWSQFTSTIKFPCIAKVSKHLPKVDLFSRSKYNKDGTPKSPLLNVKSTQGEDLIKYLEESYCEPGESLFAGRTYVDLKINYTTPLPETATKIYNLPKRLLKGAEAGKMVYSRRENIIIYPLEIVESSTATTPHTTKTESASNTITGKAVPDDVAKAVFG